MTLASELKQRQDIAREQLLKFQLEKIPIVQEAIRHTSEYGYSPDLPIQVIVDCLKDTSLVPPSEYECIGYEFMEKDGEYHIYRRIIKGINQIALEDIEWTIKDFFDVYNLGAYPLGVEMVFYE